MKKIIFTSIFIFVSLAGFSSTTWTITAPGFVFSPDSITIQTGDSVFFSVNANHNAVEVSLATWNANGTTPLGGGFSTPFGGGGVSPSMLTLGVHYYVCHNHASMGMKGRIYVVNTVGVPTINLLKPTFTLFPNPASNSVSVNYSLTEKTIVKINLFDATGKNSVSLLSETKDKGTYLNCFDLENKLAKGIYYIELMVGDNRSTQKLIIQ